MVTTKLLRVYSSSNLLPLFSVFITWHLKQHTQRHLQQLSQPSSRRLLRPHTPQSLNSYNTSLTCQQIHFRNHSFLLQVNQDTRQYTTMAVPNEHRLERILHHRYLKNRHFEFSAVSSTGSSVFEEPPTYTTTCQISTLFRDLPSLLSCYFFVIANAY